MQDMKELMVLVAEEMKRQQYSQSSIDTYWVQWRKLLAYGKEIGVTQFSADFGHQYLLEKYGVDWREPFRNDKEPRWRVNARRRAVSVLEQYQLHGTFLRNVYYPEREIATVFSDALHEYEVFCKRRLNSDITIQQKKRGAEKFMIFLENQGVERLGDISPPHISDYVKTFIHQSRRTVATTIGDLRVFLSFIRVQGYHERDLSFAVPKVNNSRSSELPTIWTQSDVERLLSVVDRGNAEGKRDYAIFLLVINYGLRNSDICNLQFQNIDWNNNTIRLNQVKGKQSLALPLRPDIGEAIIDYLKHGRPKVDLPYVFIRHSAPYDKCQNFYHILRRHMNLAGVKFAPGQKKGLHTLRFTLASRMLAENVPLETISSVLGHKTVHSTKIYLSVDFRHLRECALNPDEVFENV